MAAAPNHGLPVSRRSPALESLAVAVVLVACALVFVEALALRGVFFHYDHAIQNYPFRLFFARALHEGRFPLWTSDVFCGFPLFAESQANALYPPFLALFALLKPWVAYNYSHLLHFAWAGVGAYVLARVLRISRAGAALAGICYMLAGPVLYHARRRQSACVFIHIRLEVEENLVDLFLFHPSQLHGFHILDLSDQAEVEVHVSIVYPKAMVQFALFGSSAE